MATATEIITNFELQVSDVTELSSSEELYILNRVYNKVMSSRPWELLKTPASGTMLGSGVDGFYVTVPSDFAFFSPNYQYTNNTLSAQNNAAPVMIFIGTNYSPYQVVNFSDRRQYLGSTGYAYLDLANNKIVFTGTPVSTTYSFDYIKAPIALTAGATPIIPTRFQDVLVYGMAVDNEIIQMSPKATSYAQENQAKYDSMVLDMAYWNAKLILN